MSSRCFLGSVDIPPVEMDIDVIEDDVSDLEMLDYVSEEDSSSSSSSSSSEGEDPKDDDYDPDDDDDDDDDDDTVVHDVDRMEEDSDGMEGHVDAVTGYVDGTEDGSTADEGDDTDQDRDQDSSATEDDDDTDEEATDDDMADSPPPPPPPPPSKPSRCIACDELSSPSSAFVTAPCGDKYCAACLHLFFAATLSPSPAAAYVPPRCCGLEIPLDGTTRPLLGDHVVAAVQERRRRAWSVVVSCAFVDCGETLFTDIDADANTNTATAKSNSSRRKPRLVCVRCGRATCGACFGPAHAAARCPPDGAADAVVALGKREGWARCGRCRVMVQKSTGCDHITCICGHHFCYVCTAPRGKCGHC